MQRCTQLKQPLTVYATVPVYWINRNPAREEENIKIRGKTKKCENEKYKRKSSVQESLLLNGHIAQFRQKAQNLQSQRRSS